MPEWSGKGRKPTRERLVEGEALPQTVAAISQDQPAHKWSRHTIKEGSKGPIVADFAFLRVVAVHDELPGPEVWLILRRNVISGELKTYLSNAPVDVPPKTLVCISGMRWPIETCFEEGKQHIGMGDYQVRTWLGWHHHMTLCILDHFFLVRLRLQAQQSPSGVPPQHHGLQYEQHRSRQQHSLQRQWHLGEVIDQVAEILEHSPPGSSRQVGWCGQRNVLAPE